MSKGIPIPIQQSEYLTCGGNKPLQDKNSGLYWNQAEEYYMKKVLREREARREYRRARKKATGLHELFMLDIMREGIKNGDTRLF